MRYGWIFALLLFALPAAAQAAPELDEDGCIASAERMDAKARAKEQPTAKEKEDFEACTGQFNCEELSAAANAGKVPAEAVNTHTKGMRYTMRYCGNTSAAVKEPEPAKKKETEQTVPGSLFMQKQPESKFSR